MSMYNDIEWEKTRETKKIVGPILTELLSMLEYSGEDIGHFLRLDRRRNGTELTYANPMDNGTELQRVW